MQVYRYSFAFPILIPYAFATLLIALTGCTAEDTPAGPTTMADSDGSASITEPTYVPVGLGGLPNQPVGGTAEDINDLGHVVGTTTASAGNPRAFLWKNGVMRSLGTLGGAYSTAAAINNAGQVVGTSARGDGKPRAYIWAKGTMTGLGTLGGSRSEATDINGQGDVVGWSYLKGDPKTNPDAEVPIAHAFLWRNGRMIDLGTLGGPESRAAGINDQGHIVGESTARLGAAPHAFLWKNGVMRDIGGTGTSVPFVTAAAINWSGLVVGSGYDSPTVVASSWINGSSQMLLVDNGFGSAAYDVNGAGRIVGQVTPLDQVAQAFTSKAGVTTILPPLPNGRTADALAINKNGDIVGWSDGKGTPFAAVQPVLWRKQ